MNKRLIGAYAEPRDAETVIQALIEKGVSPNCVDVLAGKNAIREMNDTGANVQEVGHDTLWSRVKQFFNVEISEEELKTLLGKYQTEINADKILVFVDDNCAIPARQVDASRGVDEVIRLEAEHLNVDKETVAAGEFTIRKRIITEQQSIDVPVRHEELILQRVAISPGNPNIGTFEDKTYVIPLTKERIMVSKEPVVTAEYHIKKKYVEETEHIKDSIRREELDYDKTGISIEE